MDGKSKNLKTSGVSDKGSVAVADANSSELKNNKITTEHTNQNKDNEKSNIQKANDSESDKGKGEKVDEDVPEDFFDDFLKEDFMAGLDIVDEDDDTEETNEKSKVQVSDQKKSKKKTPAPSTANKKIDHVKRFKESEEKHKLSKKAPKKNSREDELQRLDRELEEIRNAPIKKPEKVGIDADNFDIRRDPEKTRQAIQRDKIKSAKDKKKRLITDIVQTGLVPPGMELEVNIEDVKPVQITDLREKIRPRKTRSKSFDNKKSVKKGSPSGRKRLTPNKRRRSPSPRVEEKPAINKELKQSYGRNRSPPRRHPSPRYKRSPVMSRNSPRHYSPPSIRNPDPFQNRSSPLRRSIQSPKWSPKRSPIRRSWRRSRSNSLTNRRSPYRLSGNREDLRTHRRDRSYSPLEKGRRRRRSRSRSPKRTRKEEKVSFLEELVAKLNETHPVQPNMPSNMPHIPPQVNYYNMPNMNPPIAAPMQPMQPMPQQPQPAFFNPVPVPQPALVQPPIQKYDPYDESFFIGNSAAITSSGPGQFKQTKDPGLVKSGSMQPQAPKTVVKSESGQKDASKLFGDKRIMLSDFLAITAKPQVNNASSAKLQEKIKVIQRCQDAIKMLNEKKFSGALVVHKTDSYKYSTDKTMSPLLRKPIVQLPFTTPGMKNSSETNFTKRCETLLQRVGITRKIVRDKQDKQVNDKMNMVPPKEITSKDSPLITIPIFEDNNIPSPIKVITKSMTTQTDKELSSCKECLRRKGILYANCGSQAGEPMLTFSVSTQVTEADFYSMIPKTQSLASLTPAQLLGKQSMISTSNNLLRGRQVPSPPPPPTFHFPLSNIQSPHGDSYPPHMFGQPSISSLLQNRVSIPPNKPYNDDRRGGFNKRF